MTDIVPSNRQVIEDKLLVALEDPGSVAIIATAKDLDLMLEAFIALIAINERLENKIKIQKAKQMAADILQLRTSAFGEPNEP